MSDTRLRRVPKEIALCNNDYKTENISVELMDDSPFHLRGSFQGLQDSPYEGGNFEVDIVLPDDYPFSSPKMKFITKVYHPNISSSGAIPIYIPNYRWTPAITLPIFLIALQFFLCIPELCNPEPDYPVDAEVAKLFASSRKAFEDTARNWTRMYARRSSHP
ncbi:ubiquitin-conjugating enzyme/RWD-like protein [Russula emetica]|nr:ubiquitin-conjugating enzyme/RWD-like protein [Russula emetica]